MAITNFLRSIEWDKESYPAFKDYIALPFFALYFLILRFLLDRYVFEKISLLIGIKSMKRTKKFKEQAWLFLYYISCEILAAYVTHKEPWFTNLTTSWLGPGTRMWPDIPIKLKLKCYYMYEGGFYLFSIYSLLALDTRRSDFLILLCHHIITFTLISTSYTLRFFRVGTVILVIHNFGDIFLALGKCCHYSGREEIGKCVFVIFIAAWTLTRLVYYPFWVIWNTWHEVPQILHKHTETKLYVAYYYIFNHLLFFVLLMHIYWTYLIYAMAYKMQRSGTLGKDVRSDSEDEHEA